MIVWKWVNSKLLKVKWEGIKGLSKTFIFAFWSSWIQMPFKSLERRWHDFFHLKKWKGCLKNNWISFGNIPILELYATQWFSREKIKWLLQIMKYKLGVSKDQFQVLLELILVFLKWFFLDVIRPVALFELFEFL